MKTRVYIAGPISRGDLADNVNRATAAFVALAKAGLAPWAPQWSVYAKLCYEDDHTVYCIATRMGNEEMSHEEWMGIDLPWVEKADAILRLPGESAGADLEVAHAEKFGIPIFTDIEALISWDRSNRRNPE